MRAYLLYRFQTPRKFLNRGGELIGKGGVMALTDCGRGERYTFEWPGKRSSLSQAAEPIAAVLCPDYARSLNWETTNNILIEGDNLQALKLLKSGWASAVDAIYIDPPYNTRNRFVYHDDYADGVSEYARMAAVDAHLDGRLHSGWLTMMMPRLILAKELLSDEGLMVVSIDQNELDNLLKLCREVFGDRAVLAVLTVVNNLKGRSDDHYFATSNEYAVVVAKDPDKAHIRGLVPSDDYYSEFKYADSISRYKLLPLRKTGRNSRRQDRPNLYYPIYVNPETAVVSLEPFVDPFSGTQETNQEIVFPLDAKGNEGCWRWGRETFAARCDSEIVARFLRGRWQIFTKMRDLVDGEPRTVRPKTLWLDPAYDSGRGRRELKALFAGQCPFDSPKPLGFIKDILRVISGREATVLDFFAGSGTTAHAVMELNAADGGTRNWILVQSPEPTRAGSVAQEMGYETIFQVTRERIMRAGQVWASTEYRQWKNHPMADLGFRVLSVSADSAQVNRE